MLFLHICGRQRLPDGQVKIALIGMGAANVATYHLLKTAGANPAAVIACDSEGILNKRRHDIEEQQAEFTDKWRVCCESNPEGITGGIAEALGGAHVCIAFVRSDPALIKPEWVKRMAPNAIVLACSDPLPEIWPWDAKEAGARVVGTGREDFPNQINNSLGFRRYDLGELGLQLRRRRQGTQQRHRKCQARTPAIVV